jgi:hypothetical protein
LNSFSQIVLNCSTTRGPAEEAGRVMRQRTRASERVWKSKKSKKTTWCNLPKMSI